jgi:DNA-binding NarL/FixJ family response regulator
VVFAVIDSRKLERECFVRVIEASSRRISIAAYESVQEWREATDVHAPCAILMNIGGRRVSDPAVSAEVEGLIAEAGRTPVIVMAESEEFREMIAAVDSGARGYIPSSVGADVVVEAARLTSAGGIFLPVSSVLALRDAILKQVERPTGIEEHFTSRQAAVADALRRGKANKTIAYELNMCESTVKVHIRTIMKKLRATNRTQAAFKLNALFPNEQAASAEAAPR